MSIDPTKELESIFKNYNRKTLNPLIIIAMDAAEKVLISNLKADSPVSMEGGEHYRDSWESKKGYRYARYIHNKKKVRYNIPGRGVRDIPLSSLLENAANSPYRGRIRRTVRRSKAAVQQAFINKVKGGL